MSNRTLNMSKNNDQYVSNKKAEIGISSGDWTLFLDALGRMESTSNYGKINELGYIGIYQFSPFGNSESIFTTIGFAKNIGAMLDATTDEKFLKNPIAQELAAIMEFSGVPDIAKQFVSKFTAIRNAFSNADKPKFDKMVGETFTISWKNSAGAIVGTQKIKLSRAGLSAAAHLVGEGRCCCGTKRNI